MLGVGLTRGYPYLIWSEEASWREQHLTGTGEINRIPPGGWGGGEGGQPLWQDSEA